MNKRVLLTKYVIFCFIFLSLDGRIFVAPPIANWLWYSNTIEYPLNFYFYNRRSNFCWDVGMSFINRYADIVLVCDSLDTGNNLSVLFHGADNFLLRDIGPITNNIDIADDSAYEFVPSYVLNETACEVNVQVSRDFEFRDNRYIHSTFRCIVPFAKQAVVNMASGNMFYNTTLDAVPEKSYRKGNDFIKKSAKRKKIVLKGSFNEDQLNIGTSDQSDSLDEFENIVSPYIKLQTVGENTFFAVQGTYFTDHNQKLFNYVNNPEACSFVVYNKNAPAGYVVDLENNLLSLDDICHSYGSVNPSSNSGLLYLQFASYNGNSIVDSDGKSYTVQNTPYGDGLPPGKALVTLYSYGNTGTGSIGGYYVKNNYGVSYQLASAPDAIYDVSIGDLVSTAPIVLGNGRTGEIESETISSNQVVKMVATGSYGENSSLGALWNRKSAKFIVPPVVVQKSESGFPENFWCKTKVNSLLQSYNSDTNGSQFDYFGDFLKTNKGNVDPKVTVLNEDGTFYDPTASCAVLWYENNYYNLFTPSSNNSLDTLKNIYITSSVNPDSDLPTTASTVIAEKIGTPPGPDPNCCDKVVAWVKKCIYKPIVENMNYNLTTLQKQIWSLTSVDNNIIGNSSPLTDNDMAGLSDVCDYPFPDETRGRGDEKAGDNITKSIIDNVSLFENGVFGSMDYNGFHQSGLGNILLEYIGGSYFYNNSLLLDLYLGLECPTAGGINNSRSYLALGIGNNGHFVGRLGFQGSYDFQYIFKFRFSGRAYLERGFSGFEKVVPQLEGYPIFNLTPVKMDTNIDWNGGLVYIDGSIYANDYSGLTFSYQYWKKGQDKIAMIAPVGLEIENTYELNEAGTEIIEPNEIVNPVFTEPERMSKRSSHLAGMSVFSRVSNELFFNCGFSRIFGGNNVPQMLDLFCIIGISY